jgi:hypothetical protein
VLTAQTEVIDRLLIFDERQPCGRSSQRMPGTTAADDPIAAANSGRPARRIRRPRRIAATDLDSERTRRKLILGGLINEYARAA